MEDTNTQGHGELWSIFKHWVWLTSLVCHVVAALLVTGIYSVNWQRTGSVNTTLINAFDVEGVQLQRQIEDTERIYNNLDKRGKK